MTTERQAWDAVADPSPPIRNRVAAANTGRPWSENDVAFLLANLSTMSAAEIGGHLQRTQSGVLKFLNKRHVPKPRAPRDTPIVRAVRVNRDAARWTEDDDAFLMDHAGERQLAFIVGSLGRSAQAVLTRLRRLGMGISDADGCYSALEVARLYGTSRWRVGRLIETGVLPATRTAVHGRMGWRIDPGDCEALRARLSAPKRTWRSTRPDQGDLYARRLWAQRYKREHGE